MSTYTVDAERGMKLNIFSNDIVYVGGLSAGAAMTVILGATYPDVFAAIAVGAGLEYQAATSVMNAYLAMSSGGPNPVTQGDIAYKEQGEYSRPLGVRKILFKS